jgi:hypothetical protein
VNIRFMCVHDVPALAASYREAEKVVTAEMEADAAVAAATEAAAAGTKGDM